MKIEILGPGCKNCNTLESVTQQALEQLGIDESITKVTDYGEIASYGVMSTPALAINGKVKTTGRIPSADEIANLITATISDGSPH